MANLDERQQWRDLERQARVEAEQRFPDSTGLRQIREALGRARADLGGGDARAHAIEFGPDDWEPDVSLPPTSVNRQRISRADGFDAAAQPINAEGNWRLFCTSFVFGYGTYGIGPARMTRILRRTPRAELCAVIAEARKQLNRSGPLAAYHYLRGKVPYWGPAFYTKLLYFADTPEQAGRALILDNQVAWMIAQITGIRHLVFGHGWSVRWTAYRYGVYLAWMTMVSERLGVPRDFLEYALFKEARRRRKRRRF